MQLSSDRSHTILPVSFTQARKSVGVYYFFPCNGGSVQCRGTLFLPYVMEAVFSAGVHSLLCNGGNVQCRGTLFLPYVKHISVEVHSFFMGAMLGYIHSCICNGGNVNCMGYIHTFFPCNGGDAQCRGRLILAYISMPLLHWHENSAPPTLNIASITLAWKQCTPCLPVPAQNSPIPKFLSVPLLCSHSCLVKFWSLWDIEKAV